MTVTSGRDLVKDSAALPLPPLSGDSGSPNGLVMTALYPPSLDLRGIEADKRGPLNV
jgi:hypothetical protein